MIVKVQLPLESNHPNPPALIYPQGKLWLLQIRPAALSEDVRRAVKVNGGKAYFYATKNKSGSLDFGAQAPQQEW